MHTLRGFKNDQILTLGAVVGGLYVLYQLVKGVKTVGSAAASAATKAGTVIYHAAQDATLPITAPVGWAAAIIWKTWDWASTPNTTPTGNVIMPDGTTLPISQLAMSFNDTYNVAQFHYQGRAFVIPQNPDDGPSYDTNGNYHAVAWDTYAASLG